ncbi:MAG: bifunctional nuclease family protein [Syntrophobacterales bacterium]|nr:bifunctional nuclease family protein [Syntrophobacterales bacterium]
MLIEMKVFGLAIDPITSTPIVILKDLEEKRVIPIWIGLFEASAIATELEKVSFSRPMTHDLVTEMLNVLGVKVQKIVINDLKDNTFFSVIHLMKNGEDIMVDSRPSDAIAIALRAGAHILVDEKVIKKSMNMDFGKKTSDLSTYSGEKLKEFLENLSPEDFGKYKM